MAQSIRDDDGVSNTSRNVSLTELVDQAIAQNPQRRLLLKSGLGAAMLPFLGGLAACGGGSDTVTTPPPATPREAVLGFNPVAASSGDVVIVPEGYTAEILNSWGDPLFADSPDFAGDASETWREAELQVGDNHDGMSFFPLPFGTESNDRGLLVLNHEYINPEYYYKPELEAGTGEWYEPFTFEKVRKGLAGHGLSVMEVQRNADGSWRYVKGSPYNRRVTGYTPIELTGPVRGNAAVRTAADPTGTEVLGTLNNCANGQTPWGTYLTCEENSNGYFGWNGSRTRTAAEARYGYSQNGFGYMWHTQDPRFDLNANPNEPNRFHWVVEVDPYNPQSKPKKRTALGRFKHENIEIVIGADNTVVAYSGDDERGDYIYKFVCANPFNPTNMAANRDLLDSGTLYVARFDAGAVAGDNRGIGEWIALVHGQNGLTVENGFADQADVLIRTRMAADFVGATRMDRPEWIAANPTRLGDVYIALTNNSQRGTTFAVDEANPRASNAWGHILRWTETGADPKATTFTWDMFLLAGNPVAFPDRTDPRSGSLNITPENMFNSPDGLYFDQSGRLWIQTDGSFANTNNFAGMGNNQMLAADVETGEVRRFLVGPSGCEITGLAFTPDRRTMFVNVQHPGEVGSHPNRPAQSGDDQIARNPTAFSIWPASQTNPPANRADAGRPRSATVVVRRLDGGVIGG
ncbi:PhoX family phosphatase [Hydrogenophaga sp.]|uniref:PhoX family protein n=1 Tax=Hydrogenophaga sp. TaxID=1904254 RepID=UPI002CD57E50|nr:PhoX family phosphatase [Hydrogenophaga sp.]HMP11766.1 PhoX family phosphatase [Hydrogenophaga sp.]